MIARALIVVPLVAAFVALTLPAWAVPPVEEAAAEMLFREGQRLMEEKNFAAACPKLAESQRLDPSAGTLLNLAVCYAGENKLASAFGAFTECGLYARSQGGKTNIARAEEAEKRAKLLEPQLSRMSIVVPDVVRATKGLTVERDGRPVPDGAWGSGLPLDAGEYTIQASAPGRLTWTQKVTLTGPGVTTVEVPPLPEAPHAPAPLVVAPPVSSTQRVAGIVVLSVGAVGLTVGAVAGGIAAAEHSNLIGACPTAVCPPSMQSNVDTYHRTGAISTGAFIAGGVLAAAGIVVVVTAPKVPAATVSPIVGLGFIGARGRF
jgi:hypothetical protein